MDDAAMEPGNTATLKSRIAELQAEIGRQDESSGSGGRQDQAAVNVRTSELWAELESKRAALALATAGVAGGATGLNKPV